MTKEEARKYYVDLWDKKREERRLKFAAIVEKIDKQERSTDIFFRLFLLVVLAPVVYVILGSL